MTIDAWYWVFAAAVFGFMLGSFAGAQVWRLRWAQLKADKASGEHYDKKEYKRLQQLDRRNGRHDRSKCLACGEQLRWYDLLPLVSWLSTAGRCRYCRARIGWFEPLVELGVAALFVASFVFWPWTLSSPLDIALFALWIVAIVIGTMLFAYDYKWSLLPDGLNYALILLGVAFASISIVSGHATILSAMGALAVLAGVYAGLYYVSYWRHGSENTWVGFGDVKLTIGLSLFLGNWQLAFLSLFLANLIGTVIVLPLLARGSVSRKAHIPFGPLLLIAAVIALLFGQSLINWYLTLFMY